MPQAAQRARDKGPACLRSWRVPGLLDLITPAGVPHRHLYPPRAMTISSDYRNIANNTCKRRRDGAAHAWRFSPETRADDTSEKRCRTGDRPGLGAASRTSLQPPSVARQIPLPFRYPVEAGVGRQAIDLG